ncbi:uncharacterized protein LOC114869265 isoform X2 [Betta splendens]|uniref:Uncharacterized protein LOC114869265 isoform X2 n=1 Tax=Betta splendens TaxID=158456 RepID=A0A9W2Y9A0_BETSP|nr:uncharacterized protein LOC114869265 isoform X2 [Betta splendens]
MVGNNRITVTALEQFLNKPPSGFSVKTLDSGYEVHGDPEKSLVLIDDLELKGRKVVFQNSMGRTLKMHDLWEYTSTRKSLLSKTVYLLASACEGRPAAAAGKAASKPRESQRFVVSVDGDDPFVKWQLERGLDWTIASVRGESYRVDVRRVRRHRGAREQPLLAFTVTYSDRLT